MNKTSSAIVRTILLGTSCLSALGLVGVAQADPAGGVVVSGSATITGKPNNTVINQATDRALINWQSFNIAAGGSVRFNQPGSKSITVNRVLGSQSSSIFGSLLANGQVWIINGNGILFGKGSQVNVGGLIATTADIADRDFENGNFSFSGGTGASVVNQGTIRTRNGGSAVLSGASVQNQGLIAADTGTVVLGGASAFTVDFTGDNLLRYAITAPAGKADNGQTGVSNSGSISAAGGHVILTARAAADIAGAVVNNTGMISATSARVANGEVVLDGGNGDVAVSGSIDASGRASGQTGGSVAITGRNITVADNTNINVSGDAGGGTVRIGGDLHGTGALQNADNVTVGAATIRADAIRRGKGGTLVVWSNGLTDFSGIFSAKGGLMGGDGGFIETSGHMLNVGTGANVDTTAPRGKTGTWLLDPDTIVIQAGEGSTTQLPPDGTLGVGTDPGQTDYITPDTIIAALATTNVTLEAANEIDVNSNVIYSSANTLSLLSEGDINVNASILNQMATGGGGLTLVAGWDGVTAPGAIRTTSGAYGNNDGEIFLDGSEGNVFVGAASGTTTVAAGEVTLTAGFGSAQLGYYGAGGHGGDIFVSTTGDVSLTGGDPTDGGTYAMIGNGAPAGSVTGNVIGDVTGNIVISAAGALNLSTQHDDCECEGPFVTTIAIGNATTSGTVSGNVTIFADHIDDFDDANGGLGAIAARDLPNGDFTAGITDSEFSLDINGRVVVNSAHTLTLLSAGDIDVNASIQNSGSGAVNLVAGWDGFSGLAQLGSAGTFGLHGGSVFLGGEGASGDVFVGSSGGTTAVYTSGLDMEAFSGATQLGFNGGGATGAIHVEATGDIRLGGGNGFAQIGHGGANTSGSASGDINVAAAGTITLEGGEGFNAYAQIGHGGANANDTPSQSFSYAGNIDVTGSAFRLTGGAGSASYVQIGHGGQNVGNDPTAAITETESGNITVTSSAGDIDLTAGGGNSYAQIGHGGAYGGIIFSESPGVLPTHSMSGAITVQAFGGSVTLTATGDENTQSDYAQIGHGGVSTSGDEGGDILVYADNDITLNGGTAQPDGLGLAYAQIGNGAGRNDTGLDTGNITVTALGDLTLNGSEGAADGTDYVQIGNGSFWNINGGPQGPASGNITINVGGATTINTTKDGGDVWIGNISGGETGAVTFVTGTFDDSNDAQGDFARFLGQDIVGGDVTLGFSDSETDVVDLPGLGTYNSANTLTILSASSLNLNGSIQNAGTGAITLVAGWDGITLDPAHLSDAGHYGLNGGSITIGGANASGDVAVGAASGLLSVYGTDINLSPVNGYAQLGYHGAGGGDIFVRATGSISGIGGTADGLSTQLGNGSLVDDITGNVTGNIDIDADDVFLVPQAGLAWLGNAAATGFTAKGNLTSISVNGSYYGYYLNYDLGTSADTGGDIFIGFRDNLDLGDYQFGGITFNSPHSFTAASAGVLDLRGNMINNGSGALTFVAGWDGHTVGSAAQLIAAHAYGLNGAALNVGGTHPDATYANQTGNIQIGTASGVTTLLGADVNVSAVEGFYTQVGYHGAGGGDIFIGANGDLTLTAGAAPHDYAMIGNGSLIGDVSGNITGNIELRISGSTLLDASAGEGAQAWIGNVAGSGFSETGNVLIQTFDLDSTDSISAILAADVVGGDVTLAITDSEARNELDAAVIYNSTHNLTLLTAGSVAFNASVQNAGSGAVTVVAGWNGITFDPAHFADAGVFGNNNGQVMIGGGDASGDVSVGSAHGITSVFSNSVIVSGVHGNAQLGYHGLGGGAVNVTALTDVSVLGSGANYLAQIGNGGFDIGGAVGGAVSVKSASLTVMANAISTVAMVGNLGGANAALSGDVTIDTHGGALALSASAGNAHAHVGNWTKGNTAGTLSGNIRIDAGDVSLVTGGANAYSQIGNGTFRYALDTGAISGNMTIHAASFVGISSDGGQSRLGNLGAGSVSGDISLITTGNVVLSGSNGLVNIGDVSVGLDANGDPANGPVTSAVLVQSGGVIALTAANNGNARIETGGSATGTTQVFADGDITLTAGTSDGEATGSFAFIGTLLSGSGGMNIQVASTHGKVALAANETNSRAGIGNSQNGSIGGTLSGTVSVSAADATNGNITLSASGSGAMTQIGNLGDDGETVSGDVSLIAGNAITIGAGNVIFGNTNSNPDDSEEGSVPAPFTGNVLVSAKSLSGNLAPSFSNALSGGDVLVEIFGPSFTLDGTVAYNSGHVFSLLSAGDITVTGGIQNGGNGAINLIAGWNGTTTNAAHFSDAGVFGNNNGAVLIGGADATGNAAVGSAGGTTTVEAKNVVLSGLHGYAQLGYHGAAGGTIAVNALGVVSLMSGTNAGDYATIGNGTVFGSNAAGGDVAVSSASITAYGNSAVTAANLKLAAASGGIGNGSPGGALRIAAGTLAVSTQGGAVYLTSPNGGVTFAGSSIQTMGGSFTLAAGGPITQSAAIQTGALNLSTTSGAITLTDLGNSFGALTVSTQGSDNATFALTSSLTVAGANVGGTLSLTGSAITQTGAIHAGALSVTGTNGPITLTDSGNAFATLTLNNTSTNDISIVDGSAVTLAGVNVNGRLTLAAGGAIGQTGAIHAGALDVSTTTGAIALTNTANTFGALTVTTHGSDNASFAHAAALTVASAHVGGTLTLAAGTSVNQSGGIHAAALNVFAATGSIVLNDGTNAFGALTASTSGANDASITDSTGVSVSSATIGGKLTLVSGGAIGQTGAIVAAALDISSTGGAISLTSSGNSFATLTVATTGGNDAAVTDSTGLTLAGANVGGKLTLAAGGAVGQTGNIVAHNLSVSASSGAINLSRATNAVVGTVQFVTPGALTFANSVATNVGASNVGGDFTLLSMGNVNFIGSVQGVAGNVTVVAGWNGTTTDPSAFGTAGVYGNGTGNIVIGGTGASGTVAVGSKNGTTSLYASNVTLSGVTGVAQLGYHGAGGGAIRLVALHDLTVSGGPFSAMLGNGSLGTDVAGAVTGDIDIRIGGIAHFNGTGNAQAWLGNKSPGGETGNLVLLAADTDSNQDCDLGCFLQADIAGGDMLVGISGAADHGIDDNFTYNSAHSLTVLVGGNFGIEGALQNAGSGAITLVAGWDGHTLDPAAFGNAGVYGNAGKGVLIGGSGAEGNASVGSFGGKTSIYGASLTLAAVHGYAQLGFNGHGAGAILVQTTGAVTLTGGAGANQFAQIGNGGRGTTGSNSGDIQITAGGDLTATAGAGAEAYAQIGHGGAESNTGVTGGYSNTGAITVTATNVFLNAGGGTGAYSQIGNGGYKSGLNIAGGTANNGGDITITSAHAVTLTGNGADAYAQIGNGGSQSNQNAAASAGGSDSGNIVVHAPNGTAGSVTLTAGAGGNAYAQIGNGGYAVNTGPNATVASWTVTGDVSVTDLVLTGGNTGPNAYAQIGNGDASRNSTGNVSGNITIDANGQITYTDGTAAHSPGTIGNFTGQGTVMGTLTGATPPSDVVTTDPVVIGNIAVNTADNGSPTTNVPVITTVVITDTDEGGRPTVTAVALETSPPGPLALLDNGGDGAAPNSSDGATIVIADSLDGTKKASGSQFFMGGMLKQTVPGSAIHGVPPADQDFSSWGNEALWQ